MRLNTRFDDGVCQTQPSKYCRAFLAVALNAAQKRLDIAGALAKLYEHRLESFIFFPENEHGRHSVNQCLLKKFVLV